MQHLKQLAFTGCAFSFAVVGMSFSRQLTVQSVDGGGARFELSNEITEDSSVHAQPMITHSSLRMIDIL